MAGSWGQGASTEPRVRGLLAARPNAAPFALLHFFEMQRGCERETGAPSTLPVPENLQWPGPEVPELGAQVSVCGAKIQLPEPSLLPASVCVSRRLESPLCCGRLVTGVGVRSVCTRPSAWRPSVLTHPGGRVEWLTSRKGTWRASWSSR